MREAVWIVIIVTLAALILERLAAQQYIEYLRASSRIEQARPMLKQGMTEAEVRSTIGFMPDRESTNFDETGTKVLVWSPKRQLGLLYQVSPFNKVDNKDFMDMFLDFDRRGHLVRIYFGG